MVLFNHIDRFEGPHQKIFMVLNTSLLRSLLAHSQAASVGQRVGDSETSNSNSFQALASHMQERLEAHAALIDLVTTTRRRNRS
jgi:hypothetical protein